VIKRTLEISQQPMFIGSKLEQLLLQPFDADQNATRQVPAEDIGAVLVDHPQTTYSHGALQTLMRHGSTLVVCGRDHLPSGIMLPVSGNVEQVTRLRTQVNASKPRLKRLWQQLVKAKIRHQRCNTPAGSVADRKLKTLAGEVRSGDTTNEEAQAARVYWSAWRDRFPDFYRKPEASDPLNVLLNYGYAVLRAAVGRAIVAAGLHPALGLHHHNRANAFCLADDLMEPLRPVIDRRVWRLAIADQTTLDPASKTQLLTVLTTPVKLDDQQGPLMVQLHRTVASLVRCYDGQDKSLALGFPLELEDRSCMSADTDACGS